MNIRCLPEHVWERNIDNRLKLMFYIYLVHKDHFLLLNFRTFFPVWKIWQIYQISEIWPNCGKLENWKSAKNQKKVFFGQAFTTKYLNYNMYVEQKLFFWRQPINNTFLWSILLSNELKWHLYPHYRAMFVVK